MVSFQYVINMKIVKKIFFVILNLWNSVCSLYLQHISIRPHSSAQQLLLDMAIMYERTDLKEKLSEMECWNSFYKSIDVRI